MDAKAPAWASERACGRRREQHGGQEGRVLRSHLSKARVDTWHLLTAANARPQLVSLARIHHRILRILSLEHASDLRELVLACGQRGRGV